MELSKEKIEEFKKKDLWYSGILDNDKRIEKDLLKLIDVEFAIDYRIIPIYSEIDNDEELKIICVTSQYANLGRLKTFEKAFNAKIQLVFCADEVLVKGLTTFFNISSEKIHLSKINKTRISDEGTQQKEQMDFSGANDPDGVQNSQYKKIYRNLIDAAVMQHASDIHLLPTSERLQVIFRINGCRVDYTDEFDISSQMQMRIINIVKGSCDPSMKENDIDGDDGRITYHYKKENESIRDIDCRVSAVPVAIGQKIVIRILDTQATIPQMDTLGYEKNDLARILKAVLKPKGIFLLAGPTGAGKSTSLAAIDAYFCPIKYNKIHVADPIEYRDERITQIDIRDEEGSNNQITYESILRYLVRQDPDNILIGEIRDKESAIAAMNFSSTGHRILTTIHASDIMNVFDRFEFIGLPRYAILGQATGLMAQRLIPIICNNCKEEYQPAAEFIEEFDKERISNIKKFYRGKGCSQCNESGISHRTAICEILVIDNEVRDKMHENLGIVETINYLRNKKGFVSIVDKCYKYLEEGQVSLDELIDIVPR